MAHGNDPHPDRLMADVHDWRTTAPLLEVLEDALARVEHIMLMRQLWFQERRLRSEAGSEA